MKVVQFIVRASASNASGSRRQLTYLGSREVKKQTGQFSTLCCRWRPSIQSLPLCSICLVHAELLPICSAPGTSSGVPVLTLRDKLTGFLPCCLRRTPPSCCLCSGKKSCETASLERTLGPRRWPWVLVRRCVFSFLRQTLYSSSGETNAMPFKASVWLKDRSKGFDQTLKTSSSLLSQMGCSCDALSGWLPYPGSSFQEVQQHTAMAVTLLETFGTTCGQEPTGMRPFNPKWSWGPLFETRTWGKRYSPF